MELTFRPRLTKGRHLQTTDESGPFCLVEAVGFNVDAKVDDSHASVDTVLASMARTLNDRMCKHYVHPLAEAAGMIEPTSAICDSCQARLWVVGERIAETGYDVAHWTEAERTALHVRLAIEAAEAAFKLVTRNTELWRLVGDALAAANACQLEPTPNNRAAARLAAERIDRGAVDDGNEPAAWAAHAGAHATRAAAALAGDTLDAVDTVTTTDFFANRRAVEAVTYALGATAGDPGRSMGIARRILNTFGKATSHSEQPGVSEVVHPDDAGAAAAEAAEPQDAQAAYAEAYAEQAARLERACEAAPSWAECEQAYNASVAAAAEDADVAELWEAKVSHMEASDADNEDVDDFEESELGDVADEAIGELEHVESILHAVAAEHRAVESWWRKGADGIPVQYQQRCCVSCRDSAGRPVPAPCRTLQLLDGYAGA